jgi:hypothetical protein
MYEEDSRGKLFSDWKEKQGKNCTERDRYKNGLGAKLN